MYIDVYIYIYIEREREIVHGTEERRVVVGPAQRYHGARELHVAKGSVPSHCKRYKGGWVNPLIP